MPQPNYNLHLKGYVGGCDFDRNYVDYVLDKNKDKPVHVLIDSLGGIARDCTIHRQRIPCAWRCDSALRGNERERGDCRLPRCQAYLHGLVGNVPGAQMQRGVF